MTTIDEMARRLDEIEARVRGLEGAAPERVRPQWAPQWRPAAQWPPPVGEPSATAGTRPPAAAPAGGPALRGAAARPNTSAHPASSLEDLVGGRVLAWLGGAAVLAGVAFLLVLAVRRGWLGEEERTVLAGLTSLALLIGGAVAQERRGHTDAARAASAAGVAGLFATLVTAARVYELIPVAAGLAGSVVVGVVATALALRWRSEGIGALGILGALAAPLLVGAPLDDATLALVWVVAMAAAVVVVACGWDWLGAAAATLTTMQWVGWLLDASRPEADVVVMLSAFGLLTAATALACAARGASGWAWPVLTGNAVVLGIAGYAALESDLWLAALGAVHLAAGLAGMRTGRIPRELSVMVATLGVVALDVAFALHFSGLVLVAGWSAVAVGFVAASDRAPAAATSASISHAALALSHLLLFEAPPEALSAGLPDVAEGLAGLGIAAAAAAVAAVVAPAADRRGWTAAACLVVLYGASLAIVSSFGPHGQDGQLALSAFWALTGIGALVAGLVRDAPAVRAGAFGLIGVAAGKVFLVDLASLTALYRVGSFMAFGVLALAGAYAWQRIRPAPAD